jgi:hypothetical protein
VVTDSAELVSVGVDYVTATQIISGGRTGLQTAASQWLDSERRAGNDVREFASHGYIGLHAGSVAVATNGTRLLVKLGGAEAQAHAKDLIEQADSISRLDLQTTVRIPNVRQSFAESLERRAKQHKLKHSLKYDVDLRRHDRRGKTIYLGARASERLIRVYDKGAESQLPELRDCWRAECEFHKPLSEARAAQVLKMGFDSAWVSQVVQWELSRRGIRWPALLDGAVLEQPSQALRKRSDSAARLSWLSLQVRPTIEKLRAAGLLDHALEALGLLDHKPEGTHNDGTQ